MHNASWQSIRETSPISNSRGHFGISPNRSLNFDTNGHHHTRCFNRKVKSQYIHRNPDQGVDRCHCLRYSHYHGTCGHRYFLLDFHRDRHKHRRRFGTPLPIKPPLIYLLVTPTNTVTDTITTTTTLPTPTSTVPTSPGFVPVASATAQFNARRRRDLLPRSSRQKPVPNNKCSVNKGGQVSYSPVVYPTAVKCAELVEVFSTSTIVVTGQSTATQTASTPLVTTTVTDTITSTSVPVDASTTLSFSTTITDTTTVVDPAVTSTVRYALPLSSLAHASSSSPASSPFIQTTV